MNGEVVTEMGFKVGPSDVVSVNGKTLSLAKLYYVAMNKPSSYVTTLSDPHANRTVQELLPEFGVQLKPVGRLDKETEGLLLFTNDGELAMRLTHPRFGVEKEYQVAVTGKLSPTAIRRMRSGIRLEGEKTAPAKVEGIFYDENKAWTFFRMIIHEGRKRQIREMCLAVGHPVKRLKRVRFGPLHLNRLPKGTCRLLSNAEIVALRKSVGLSTLPSGEGKARDARRKQVGDEEARGAGRPKVRVPRRSNRSR